MLQKVCNAIVLVVLLGSLAIIAVLGIPILSGKQLYAVETASMEPAYPVGSIVVVEPVDAEAVLPGDVITFELAGFESLITHRVMELDPVQREFYTKGDNNGNMDFYPVPFDSVVGRVQYGIPMLGRVVSLIRTPAGILTLLWCLLLIIALLFLPELVRRAKKLKLRRDLPAEAGQPGDGELTDGVPPSI